jgi:hypothetical protein
MGGGGGGQETQGPPASYCVWGRGGGEGEVRVTVLSLHATCMHVDLSFSYLRLAEAASFDKKEFRRNSTSGMNIMLCGMIIMLHIMIILLSGMIIMLCDMIIL